MPTKGLNLMNTPIGSQPLDLFLGKTGVCFWRETGKNAEGWPVIAIEIDSVQIPAPDIRDFIPAVIQKSIPREISQKLHRNESDVEEQSAKLKAFLEELFVHAGLAEPIQVQFVDKAWQPVLLLLCNEQGNSASNETEV